MNSIQRLTATLEGRQPDRRAISLTLSLYGAQLTRCDLSSYYTNPAAYARGQTAVREAFRPDILFGPFVLPFEGEAFGSQCRFFADQPPNLSRPATVSADELGQLQLPDVDSHPRLLYIRESIQLLAAQHGREVPIAAIALSPVDLPIMIMGMEGWLQTLLFDEAGTQRMLAITVPHFVRWVNCLLAAGASLIVLPVAFANPAIITRQIAERVTIPIMRRAFQEVRGALVLHHTGAPINAFLDLLHDLPNVAAVCVDGNDDLTQARAKVGSQMVLIGNISGLSLVKKSLREVKESCLSVLRDRRDDPRFVLGTSAADIDMGTPPENIQAFRDVAESFSWE